MYSSVYKVLSLIYIVIHGGKQWLFEDIGRGNQTYHGSPFFWLIWVSSRVICSFPEHVPKLEIIPGKKTEFCRAHRLRQLQANI